MAGVSLSAYVREVLSREVSTPPMDEVMARIARREPVHVSNDDIFDAIREGRR
ncbi:MAG: FitA-like ribbon-helix-helix domain-containing protein [Stackebrandtia sp.]